MMRRVILGVAVAALSIGPWLGAPTATPGLSLSYYASPAYGLPANAAVDGPAAAPLAGAARPTGCTCREVVVEAENVVRNADVRSGDAEMVNNSITYIAPTYGDDEVEVDQEAEAHSGHAIAGQILNVDAGEGCSRVHVRARNIVEDSEVRSGDAFAHNKSVVMLDPRVQREDLEIDVEQEAEASSGDAVAGQVIGVRGGGGPCGGVIVEAMNRVREVDVRSGVADFLNESDIFVCESEGCVDDLRELLKGVDYVQYCDGDECEEVAVADFVEMLENPPPPAEDPDDDRSDEHDADDDDDERDEAHREREEAKRADLEAKKESEYERLQQYRGEPASDTAVEDEAEPEES